MSEEDDDSFLRWLRQQDKKTSLWVAVMLLFALYGIVTFVRQLAR